MCLSLCPHPAPCPGHYQLLDDPFHQGGEADVVAVAVVIHVLHQLGDALRVCLRLEVVALALLQPQHTFGNQLSACLPSSPALLFLPTLSPFLPLFLYSLLLFCLPSCFLSFLLLLLFFTSFPFVPFHLSFFPLPPITLSLPSCSPVSFSSAFFPPCLSFHSISTSRRVSGGVQMGAWGGGGGGVSARGRAQESAWGWVHLTLFTRAKESTSIWVSVRQKASGGIKT